jgi:hypothetical protein
VTPRIERLHARIRPISNLREGQTSPRMTQERTFARLALIEDECRKICVVDRGAVLANLLGYFKVGDQSCV